MVVSGVEMVEVWSRHSLLRVGSTCEASKVLVLFCAAAKPSTRRVNSTVGVYMMPGLRFEEP